MKPAPSAICTAPIRPSQSARQLAWSEFVGGNQPGNALGTNSMIDPKAAKARALRIFIGR